MAGASPVPLERPDPCRQVARRRIDLAIEPPEIAVRDRERNAVQELADRLDRHAMRGKVRRKRL
jgi:hypothetical protein